MAGLKNPGEKSPGAFARFLAAVASFFGLGGTPALPKLGIENPSADRVSSQSLGVGGRSRPVVKQQQSSEALYKAALKAKESSDIVKHGEAQLAKIGTIENFFDPTKKPNILFNLGQAYFKLNEPLKALGKFNELLKLDPKDVGAHASKCKVLCYLGQYQQAMNAVNAAKTALGFDKHSHLLRVALSGFRDVEQWGVIAKVLSENRGVSSDKMEKALMTERHGLGWTNEEESILEDNFDVILKLDNARQAGSKVEAQPSASAPEVREEEPTAGMRGPS